MSKLSALRANTCPNEPFLNTICATEGISASNGMDFGPNFVPVRVEFGKFCATIKGRGFALPS